VADEPVPDQDADDPENAHDLIETDDSDPPGK
jgi:hypothetical protein